MSRTYSIDEAIKMILARKGSASHESRKKGEGRKGVSELLRSFA